jgi:hypothetical protein
MFTFEILVIVLFDELFDVDINDKLIKSDNRITITSKGLWTLVLLKTWNKHRKTLN